MKNLIKAGLFIGIVVLGCNSIPKVQKGDYVSKITKTGVELENGKKLRMGSEKKLTPSTFILVRHAEKMKDSKNPDLTKKGKERATKLAQILSDFPLDHVFSSDYKRTIQTANPTAQDQNKKVEIYNARQIKDFANKLLLNYEGKKVLVVGHSNTTPQLLNYLVEEEVMESIDESDYENLFIVNVFSKKTKKSILVKF